jgi:GDP-D-mannose dehydratase
MASRALIEGATGLIGSNLAEHLVAKGWEVYGIARKPQGGIPGVRPAAYERPLLSMRKENTPWAS